MSQMRTKRIEAYPLDCVDLAHFSASELAAFCFLMKDYEADVEDHITVKNEDLMQFLVDTPNCRGKRNVLTHFGLSLMQCLCREPARAENEGGGSVLFSAYSFTDESFCVKIASGKALLIANELRNGFSDEQLKNYLSISTYIGKILYRETIAHEKDGQFTLAIGDIISLLPVRNRTVGSIMQHHVQKGVNEMHRFYDDYWFEKHTDATSRGNPIEAVTFHFSRKKRPLTRRGHTVC